MYRYMNTARMVMSSERVSVRPPRRSNPQAAIERYQLDFQTWQSRLQGVNGSQATVAAMPVSLPAPVRAGRAAA